MKSTDSSVRVTADKAGNVIVPSSNNPEWGHIRVEQVRIIVDDRGFARKKTVSALIPGLIDDLKDFGWNANDEIAGKIIFKEQLEPFNKKQPERDYKVAGVTGVVCCIDGEPIYRKTFFTTDTNAQDVQILDEFGQTVSHTNGDDIRAAYQKLAQEASTEEVNLDKI